MSRGCGEVQRVLFSVIYKAENPVTYAEIVGRLLQEAGVNDPMTKLRPDRERAVRRALKGLCDRKLRPDRERAVRRALKGLCDRNLISALGNGRPGDLYRYSVCSACVLCGETIPDGGAKFDGKRGCLCLRCAAAAANGYWKYSVEQSIKELAEASEPDRANGAQRRPQSNAPMTATARTAGRRGSSSGALISQRSPARRRTAYKGRSMAGK
jgi:hypothetical protein